MIKETALFFWGVGEHVLMSETGLPEKARLEQEPEVGESRGTGGSEAP